MKRIFRYILLLSLSCGYSSCDILEVNPKEFTSPDNFFETEDEITSALYGVYGSMHNIYIGDYERIFAGDIGVDVMITRQSPRIDVYQYYQMQTPTTEWSERWRAHYDAIGGANMVINRTQKSTVDEKFKDQIIAEAKVLRAFFYHGLVLFWGDVPMWLNEFDINVVPNLPRSPKADVMKQIYEDLETAIPYLPESYMDDQSGRFSSWVAKSLLSRICLFENDWQKAYDLSTDVIDNSPHELLLNYTDVFDVKQKFNKELIMVVPSRADASGSQISTFTNPRARDEQGKLNPLFKKGLTTIRPDGVKVSASKQLFQGWGMFNTTENYLDSFEPDDIRKQMVDWSGQTMSDGKVVKFVGGDGGGTGHYMLKWSTWDEITNNGSHDLHHIRLGELYLIKAEAANELNKPDEAIDALNELRKRAFGDGVHNYSKTLDKDGIKKAIVNENKWELGGEGLRRWYLIHWGYDYLYAAVQALKDENIKGAANIKPHHVLFKIPVEEFIKNPNLSYNNPGY